MTCLLLFNGPEILGQIPLGQGYRLNRQRLIPQTFCQGKPPAKKRACLFVARAPDSLFTIDNASSKGRGTACPIAPGLLSALRSHPELQSFRRRPSPGVSRVRPGRSLLLFETWDRH